MPVLHDHSFSNDDLAIAYQVNSCRCSHPVQMNNNYTVYCLLFMVKSFASFKSLPPFLKKFLQLSAFTSFYSTHVQKFAKNLGCKVICDRRKGFLPQIISNSYTV